MRKRFNRNAVCSSENYSASKHAHLDMLKEKHDHFCGLLVSGKIELDVPEVKPDGALSSERFKTITIFGKEIRLTIEEYRTHYIKCNF